MRVMAEILTIDIDAIYKAWREHLIAHTKLRNFGMITDGAIAKFPYGNLRMIGNLTNASDMENNEATWNLSFQTDFFINTTKLSEIYEMDSVSRRFFAEHGFRKMGESVPQMQNKVTQLTSRYNMPHYNGIFIQDI